MVLVVFNRNSDSENRMLNAFHVTQANSVFCQLQVLHRVNPSSAQRSKKNKKIKSRNSIFCSTVIRIKYCLHSRPIASGNYWWEHLLLHRKKRKVLSVRPWAFLNCFYFITVPQRHARLDFKLGRGSAQEKKFFSKLLFRTFAKAVSLCPALQRLFAENKMKFSSVRYTLQSAFGFRCTAAELSSVITIRTLQCLVHTLFKLNHIDYSNFIGEEQFFFKRGKKRQREANSQTVYSILLPKR